MPIPPVRVLIAGGSYAGLGAAINLLNLSIRKTIRWGLEYQLPPEVKDEIPLDIHIVDERDGYLHLIGCPLAFSSNEYAPKIWHKFDAIPALQHPNIRLTKGSIVKIDTELLTAQVRLAGNGEETHHTYDYFVAASGLRRVYPVVPQSLTRKQYLLETTDHIHGIRNARDGVVVIGGGAVGIEMAAELKLVLPSMKVTLIHSRDALLSSEPLPAECSTLTIEVLKELGVELILGKRVLETTEDKDKDGRTIQKVVLQDGTQLTAGRVITAISRSVPTTSYLPKSYLNDEGLVKIDNRLRFLNATENNERHFAIGDLVAWPGIKRCGGAMAMGRTAALNIFQQILSDKFKIGPQFEEWPEYPPMIALAIGKKAMVYDPAGGPRCSTKDMSIYFGDDLGFKQCWDHMKLSEPW